MKNMKKVLSLLAVALVFVQCSTVPITGRQRVNFVSDAQILPMSFQQYNGFLTENKSKVITNTTQGRQLQEVGRNVSAAVDRFLKATGKASEANSYKWEFNLIQDETINAWCMPGGKVVFYTGIMPICANTDGVAAVMGHEVAHAFAKHGQERMSKAQIQQIGGAAVAIGTQNSQNAQLWNMAYGLGSTLGMLKYSRLHETEADRLGLVFMIMAGYRGEEAVNVWVRMQQRAQQSGAQKQPEFLSTHPHEATRIADLKAYLPTAKKYAEQYNAMARKAGITW